MRYLLGVLAATLVIHGFNGCGSGSTEGNETPDIGSGDQITCTSNEFTCEGEVLLQCDADGTAWSTVQTCAGGCENGECVEPTCEPDCDGKDCGPDGCEGECGTCPDVAPVCDGNGKCALDCEPDCSGKDCGPDGCEGSCGDCYGTEQCTEDGLCALDCEAVCEGVECGTPVEGCDCGTCDDSEVCTDDLCIDGSCSFENNSADCDDSDPCTENDTCSEGTCAGTETNCGDGNPCTDDSCTDGVCANPNNTANCDDGNPCTEGDTCSEGECAGDFLPIEDLMELNCTCLEDAGCLAVEDGDICNGTLHCIEKDIDGEMKLVCSVAPATIPDCDDQIDCSVDECDPIEGCQSNPDHSVCDDSNICTDDVCLTEGTPGCSNTSVDDGTPCDDGWECLGGVCICVPDCEGKDCDSDGCEGSCGVCQGIQDLCVVGLCVCQAACENKDCGPDGCSGTCGECLGVQDLCLEGGCVCIPDCTDKLCGSNGCDGDCGQCPGDQEVCVEGACVCVPDCEDKECGSDGCTGNCGSCTGPQEECVEGLCVCQPDCGGKECGVDGCGEECGTCLPYEECQESECVATYQLTWVTIEGGMFLMGCAMGDSCTYEQKPQHVVDVLPFQILDSEVTEQQYVWAIGVNPSFDANGSGDNYPVDRITWVDAGIFCETVGGRLCTEAEWEYAARGGTDTPYFCGENVSCLNDYAWWDDNTDNEEHAVKTKLPNAFGLYDMFGNVREWVEDCYHAGYDGAPAVSFPAWNEPCPGKRTIRGGSYGGTDDSYKASWRLDKGFDDSIWNGFRCCRSLP